MIISEETFYEEYKPQINHLDDNASFDGCMYETYGEELEYVFELAKKQKRVWTIIEGDEGMCFSAGFHYVNRLGFLITEKPYESEEDYVEMDEDLTGHNSIDVGEVIFNTLSGYIEDCAGEGSEESEIIESAWAKIKPVLYLSEEEGNNLKTILDSLDPESNLHGTMRKVLSGIGVLKS